VAGRLDGTPDVGGRRRRVTELCSSLPEVGIEPAGAQHLAFKVSTKVFGYYLYDHHGDGKIAIWCKAPPGEQRRLVEERPDIYFVPAYVGPRGWIGVRLDRARVNWPALKDHLFAAWLMTAPAAVRRRVRADEPTRPARAARRQRRRNGA
jgi:hypothetical protein